MAGRATGADATLCGMARWLFLAALMATSTAGARPDTRAQAAQVVKQYLSGAMGLNQAVNRVDFLGEHAWVSVELTLALRQLSDARQQRQALELLAAVAVPDADVEAALLRGLKGDDAPTLVVCARGLGRVKSARAVPSLTGLLAHPTTGVRREAARALGAVGDARAGAPLLKALKAEVDLETRLLFIQAAGRSGDRKVQAPLEPLLEDASEATRTAAAQALCALGSSRGLSYAKRLLGSGEAAERLQGVMLFEGAPLKVMSPALQPVLAGADARARARAARLLAEAGDRARVDWLVLESARAVGEQKLVYEDELERLHVNDEQRRAVLQRAGAK